MIRYILLIFIVTSFLNAANWLVLQGTEKKVGHNLWGFLQVRAEDNNGEIVIQNGINKTPFSYIKPTLEKQSELQISRARVGLRGALDKENKINYFLLTELAQNGVNNPLGHYTPTYLIDASVTLKYLPVNIRFGKFKYPGSEEGNMARFTSPFINFTTLSNQLMLERFVDNTLSKPSQGVGAYRDSGIELFKAFKIDDKSNLTVAYMLGNGSATANKNINKNHFTHYGYLSYEHLLGGGKGYKQESIKMYAWMQEGKRLFDNQLYDRDRYGIGMTYFHNALRVEAEYMKGTGMILNGVKDINTYSGANDWVYAMEASNDNRADGYYIASTYRVFSQLELLARYDVYNRLKNNETLYRKFDTFTSGVSYIFKGYDRIDLNYAQNKIKAPQNNAADAFLDRTVGNLLTLQLTLFFK